ncbi:MAG TPA: hypothetical protein VLM91_07130 [Candidatus Methylomirabilis sp.]|nr:hypothetical protein [Candidatus Methylomirabilis sp.]
MKIAGHTMGTPEYTLPEAIRHDEYRSGIRTEITPAELGELRQRAEGTADAVQAVNHPAVGLVHDQGNLTMQGAEEYGKAIPLQAPFLVHAHVKDLSSKDWPPR